MTSERPKENWAANSSQVASDHFVGVLDNPVYCKGGSLSITFLSHQVRPPCGNTRGIIDSFVTAKGIVASGI